MPIRSFGPVDEKVAEADFFLERLSECGRDFFAARCFTAAFVGSTRSVTYAVQASLAHQEGFAEWYRKRQAELQNDPTCRFFHQFRRFNHHLGHNFLSAAVSVDGGRAAFFFGSTKDIPEVAQVPREDVQTACTLYMIRIVSLVFACYEHFGPVVDAHRY